METILKLLLGVVMLCVAALLVVFGAVVSGLIGGTVLWWAWPHAAGAFGITPVDPSWSTCFFLIVCIRMLFPFGHPVQKGD